MPSIRAHIWNGRPAPSEHDTLPVARIGTVQPYGVMLVVSPESGVVEHVSANIEQILGVPARAVLGQQPTVAFRDPESTARLAEILRPGRQYFDNPTPLTANGRRFEAVCHIRDGRLFIEIEPYVEAEHDYSTMVNAALEAVARQTTVQGLYDAAARTMSFVTGWDRVKLYKFLPHGHGVVVAEKHSANSQLPNSFLGFHFSASDIPENAKEILRTGKTRQKPTQTASVPLLMRGPDGEPRESGQAVDLTDCWLRGIHPCDNGYNRNLGVGSNIVFPVCLDSTLWGLFVVHNRDEKFLNYDTRTVIEQLTMMFVSRLIEVEASEARIEERQRLAVQMLGAIEAGQDMLANTFATRNAHGAAVRLQAMQAVSRCVAALAPTYVSATGVDYASPGRPEDRLSGELLRLLDADGAAVIRSGTGGHVHLIGATPDPLAVRGLASLFGNRLPAFDDAGWRVFATDALADFAPVGDEMRQLASGLVAAPIGNRGDMILWFRREHVVDAVWAGKPPTEAELHSEMMFKSRSDFAAHRAPLGGASRPWLETEVLLAAQFAGAVGELWQRQQRGGASLQPGLPTVSLMEAEPGGGAAFDNGSVFGFSPATASAAPRVTIG
jgi:light-regulated signal transduction histidine kinase (bacteriophytochrome)